MAALSASRFVCSEMPVIVSTMPPIRAERSARRRIAVPICSLEAATCWIATGGVLGGGDALTGGVARVLGGLRGRLGGRRCSRRGTGGLLDRVTRGLDDPHLALGTLGDVADGVGDLATRRGPLPPRSTAISCEVLETVRELPAMSPISWLELAAHLVVAGDRAVDLLDHGVRGRAGLADLVAQAVVQRLGDRRDRDCEVALGQRPQAAVERVDVVLVEAAQPLGERREPALGAALEPDARGDAHRGQQEQRGDQREAGGGGVVLDLGQRGVQVEVALRDRVGDDFLVGLAQLAVVTQSEFDRGGRGRARTRRRPP